MTLIEDVIEESASYKLPPAFEPGEDEFVVHPGTARFVGSLMRFIDPKSVVEFGSGLSSLVLASEMIGDVNRKLVSIDHLSAISSRARETVRREVRGAEGTFDVFPIRPRVRHGKLLFFYSIPSEFWKAFEPVDFVFVDAPPSSWRREAALYEIYDRMRDGGYLVLDDTNRGSLEGKDLDAWERFYGEAIEVTRIPHIGRGIGVVRKTGEKPAGRPFPITDIARRWVSGSVKIARYGWGVGSLSNGQTG